MTQLKPGVETKCEIKIGKRRTVKENKEKERIKEEFHVFLISFIDIILFF